MPADRGHTIECRFKELLLKRFSKLAVMGLLGGLVVLYVGDGVVLRVRDAHGTGYRMVQVNQFLTTPLKGQKEEYDMTGTISVTCARSIFPQGGAPACWWLERHKTQWK